MKRSVLVAATSLLCALALAACTSETKGVPSAGNTAGAGPSTDPFPTGGGSTPKTSASTSAKGPMADVAPCSVLGSADVSGLGLQDQKEDTQPGLYRSCVYHFANAGGTVRVGIFDEVGINDVQDRTQLTPMQIGKHDAIRGVSPGGACVIAIKVTDKSRVDVSVVRGGDEQKACELVRPVADAVERKLPSS